MSFIADKQTLDDLNILGKYKPNSIFNLFNQVKTVGGERLLEHMFQNPLTDHIEINKRSSTFSYFQDQQLAFPFLKEEFSLMEDYLYGNSGGNLLVTGMQVLKKQIMDITVKDEQYGLMISGIQATINILKTCRKFMNNLADQNGDHPYLETLRLLQGIFSDDRLGWLFTDEVTVLSFIKILRYDHLFRNLLSVEMNTVMKVIYDLDVYLAVGHVARLKSLSYARALPKEMNRVIADDMRHPALGKAVGNLICFHQNNNMIFLTGANMAGKSTFMKTFGISVYLSHMGFPIGAAGMQFSVKDGIYSSINVPDNLNLGLSHFYAEVLRVKKAAQEVSSGKNLVVIFDELFKGTNVKDAYDATLSVTAAFSVYRKCFFIISTHIIEVGEALQKSGGIQFLYLPTVMEGNVPGYTYKLMDGITTDRQGMMIIENEGILEIISGNKNLIKN